MSTPSSPTGNSLLDSGFDELGQMLSGTSQLASEPGVVYALVKAQASPQEAGAVDQFLKALQLHKQVQIARSTGNKITFTVAEQQSLDALGVPYSDVQFGHQDQAKAETSLLEQRSGGLLTVKTDDEGNAVTDANGNPVAVSGSPSAVNVAQASAMAKKLGVTYHAPAPHRGFWGNIGHFLNQEVVQPAWRDALKPVVTYATKGFNLVNDALSQSGGNVNRAGVDPTHYVEALHSQVEDMRAKGYDPDSIWSSLAYRSSGKAINDESALVGKYGQDKVNEVASYLNDPSGYRKAIEDDPTNFTTDANGQTALTTDAADKLTYLSSDEFRTMAGEYEKHTASIGNEVANTLRINPVAHPTLYAATAAVTNIAASFAIDPTLVAGKIYKLGKLDQVGSQLMDSQQVAATLDPVGQAARMAALNPDAAEAASVATTTKQGLHTAALQRRTQDFLDLTHAEAAARSAGDVATANGLDARIAAQYAEWNPLRADVLGTQQIKAWDVKTVKGVERAAPVLGDGTPIRTLGEFADYIASKNAILRLATSKAAVQSAYMPGAVSSFGARYLKGKFAGWLTTRATAHSIARDAKILSRAEADPALARDLETEGIIERIAPHSDDAVHSLTGAVISDRASNVKFDLGVIMGALREQGAQAGALSEGASKELASLQERYQQLWDNWADLDPADLPQVESEITKGQNLLGFYDNEAAVQAATRDYGAANTAGQEAPKLASQARAMGVTHQVTPKGRGWADYNIRRTGNPLGGRAIGWASLSAIAARGRLSATRLSTLLPRNTEFDIEDATTADKVFSYARLYANRADASMLRAQFIAGDAGQRKAILDGVMDQVFHAAGLPKSEAGRNIMDAARTVEQRYSTAGPRLLRNGREVALHSGQTRQVWRLPGFHEIQMAAAKIGLWETTLGRAFSSGAADRATSILKLGWLSRPATITRNQLEGWLRMTVEGQLGDALKARAYATMRNKDAWRQGIGTADLDAYKAALESGDMEAANALQSSPIVIHHLAEEAGDDGTAKSVANASLMTGQQLGRSAFSTRLADFAPFALAGRAYRRLYGRSMTEGELASLETLGSDELAEFMQDYGRQVISGDLGMYRAAKESKEIAKSGFGPSYFRRAVQEAKGKAPKARQSAQWTQRDTDGTVGADRYAHALAQRVNDSPDVAKAALDVVENPVEHGIGVVVDAMDALDTTKARLLGWGHDFWPTGGGEAVRATTPKEVALGKEQMAREIVADYRALVTGQNGKVQTSIGDYIREHGVAPDSEWIGENLKNADRPGLVLAPEVIALAPGGVKGLVDSLMDMAGAGYAWMVERPLQRTTTAPSFLANYAKARYALNGAVDQLVAEGISREAAGTLAKEISVRNAWIKAETLIDDPGQKSQFDIVARNVFPFSRATQAMIRRWGGALWRDPLKARQMMLAYDGATQSGFIYQNAYGEPTFVYPASGVFSMALREIAKIPGLHNIAKFPIAGDMTGGVLMAVPGADNPLRMSASPFVMIPLREAKKLMPGNWQVTFDQVDSAINGPYGVGETFSELEPSVFKKFYSNLSEDDRNSALASSMMGAIANLAATGQVPTPDAPPSVRQAFLDNLKTQVHSQLFIRAVFGLFAPASPSQPTEDVPGSEADYAFQVQGVRNLSDEYKSILNEVDGDLARASAIWTAIHPDKVVYGQDGTIASYAPAASAYETPKSQATSSRVAIPSTADALRWMTDNKKFIDKYSTVAAYFLPEADTGEPFDDQAYNLQIELGLRQRKTPSEFLNDLTVKNAESVYYPVVDQVQAKIDQAKAQGNTDLASQLNNELATWKQQFKGTNPAFAEKVESYAGGSAGATAQLADLRSMVEQGEVPDGRAPLLALMIKNYDGYQRFINEYRGNDKQDLAARQAALQAFQTWAQASVTGTPLEGLWNGVFRNLNTNLSPLDSTS